MSLSKYLGKYEVCKRVKTGMRAVCNMEVLCHRGQLRIGNHNDNLKYERQTFNQKVNTTYTTTCQVFGLVHDPVVYYTLNRRTGTV